MTMGESIHFGSLDCMLKVPHHCHKEKDKQDAASGCQKTYFAIDKNNLAKFQITTTRELETYLQKIRLTRPETLVEWKEVRETLARLRRLSNILCQFPPRQMKRKDWNIPSSLQESADEAESIMLDLQAAPFYLGREILRDNRFYDIFDKELVPDATPQGVQ